MVILTGVLAAAIVVRPIRWTLDEVRFAVGAPAVAGGARGPGRHRPRQPAAGRRPAPAPRASSSSSGRRSSSSRRPPTWRSRWPAAAGAGAAGRAHGRSRRGSGPARRPARPGVAHPRRRARRPVAARPGLLHRRAAGGLRHQLHAVGRAGQPVLDRLPAGHTTARRCGTSRSRCTTTTTTCGPRIPLRRRGGPGRSTSSRCGSSSRATPTTPPASPTTPATW